MRIFRRISCSACTLLFWQIESGEQIAQADQLGILASSAVAVDRNS
jgi:hypothetical protein